MTQAGREDELRLKRPKHPDVVVLISVEISVDVSVGVEVVDDVGDVVTRLEAQNGPRLADLDLVVPEVLDVLELELDPPVEKALHLLLDLVTHLSDGVVVGRDVEDPADRVIGLDGAQIRGHGIPHVENRSP